jgi:3-hydroxyacyl-[acyl-carrier-protein] dehydratase
MRLEVEIITAKRNIWKFKAEAKVDGKVVAEAELMCAEQEVA